LFAEFFSLLDALNIPAFLGAKSTQDNLSMAM
jgi:hypothetical protein